MEKCPCDLRLQLKGLILQHRHFLTHAKEMTLAPSITFYTFWWQRKHKGMNLSLRLIFTVLLLSQCLEKPEQPDSSNAGEEQPHILLSPDFWKSWDVFPLGTWLLKAWEVPFEPLWWSWHNLLCCHFKWQKFSLDPDPGKHPHESQWASWNNNLVYDNWIYLNICIIFEKGWKIDSLCFPVMDPEKFWG